MPDLNKYTFRTTVDFVVVCPLYNCGCGGQKHRATMEGVIFHYSEHEVEAALESQMAALLAEDLMYNNLLGTDTTLSHTRISFEGACYDLNLDEGQTPGYVDGYRTTNIRLME